MRLLDSRSFIVADEISLYRVVCSSGKTKVGATDFQILADRIGFYYQETPDVSGIASLAKLEQKPFVPLRKVKRVAVKKIRKELLLGAEGSCPYCGELVVPVVLDHFLPKEPFPEYAILSANLVPICGDCNTAKGMRIRDSADRRLFCHPYFDDFLRRRLVQATIRWSGMIPAFRLRARAVLSKQNRELVNRHLRACNRDEKFSIAAAKVFRTWRDQQHGAAPYSPIELRRAIAGEISRHDGGYGKNNWRSVALRALLTNQVACRILGA